MTIRNLAPAAILASVVFLAAAPVRAAAKAHQIDAGLDACKEANPSTMGMIQCYLEASEKWDSELNAAYGALIGLLDIPLQAELRNSQRSWLEHRDLEIRFLRSVYGAKQGTLYKVILAGDMMELTRKRALALGSALAVVRE